jgi:hypothetical protein
MLADGGGDLRLKLLDLRVQRLDRRDQAQYQLPAGGRLELPDPGRGGAAELCEQLRGLLAAGLVLSDEEPVQARFNRPGGPGQNRASSARSWLVNAVPVPTKSSLARVSALSALV